MNCRELKQMIDRFVEDAVDASERRRAEKHLQACSDCNREVNEHRKVWLMLGEMKEIEPAPDYLERFRQLVDSEVSWYRELTENIRGLLGRRWALPAFCTALAALLVVAIVSLNNFPRLPSDGAITASNDIDVELLTHMELVEDYDIINELDLLSDLEFIERLDGRNAS